MSQSTTSRTAAQSLDALLRASAETARATKRLRGAAAAVAGQIEQAVSDAGLVGAKLPGGYVVSQQRWRGQLYGTFWLTKHTGSDEYGYPTGFCVDGCGGYFAGDFNCENPDPPTPAELREFVRDVQAGLVRQVADFLAARAAAADTAAAQLESATA